MMPAPIAAATSLSDGQKIALAAELLAQCPPGEFADVLQGAGGGDGAAHGFRRGVDIGVILGDNNLLAGLQEAIEKRNVNSGIVLQVPLLADSDAVEPGSGEDGRGTEEGWAGDGRAARTRTVPLLLSEYNRLSDGSFEEQETGLMARVNPFNLVRAHGHLC